MEEASEHLEKIAAKYRDRDYGAALNLCNEFPVTHPDAYRILFKRAHVHWQLGNRQAAIEDLNVVVDIRSNEPGFRYVRSFFLIDQGDYVGAVDDLTEVLRLGKEAGSDYYREDAQFVRAYCWLKLRKFSEALADCQNVKSGYNTWIEGAIRYKTEIVEQAMAGLSE